MRHMDPVLSEPVYDKKSTNTLELRICQINKESGQCMGSEELYLLYDQVQKGSSSSGPSAAGSAEGRPLRTRRALEEPRASPATTCSPKTL
ncbi:transcription factor RelB-like [Oryctolagus cuniculus]|uniref:transcription factor RelB-like n=1 Tax=Oryctolagus cuniculus TaxID=9986 RepID=UPI003879DE16